MYDCVVVGAGFSGASCARVLAEAGKRVLVVEKRRHIGGNAHDQYNDYGLLVHTYGPHIFHTNSQRVWDFLSQFTAWRPYEHRVRSQVNGVLYPFPINLDTHNMMWNVNMNVDEFSAWLDRRKYVEGMVDVKPENFEEAVVKAIGREYFELFFKNYTIKQWGLDPKELSAAVAARVPARASRDDRYFTDVYQAMPTLGFTALFDRMLDHHNIHVLLGARFDDVMDIADGLPVVWTGPIDEYFHERFGPLPYRCLNIINVMYYREKFQDWPVVNYPNQHAYTRSTEYKYLTGQDHKFTAVSFEVPGSGEPYYPMPTEAAKKQYALYKAEADKIEESVLFAGRMGTYKYLNMDQACANGLMVADKLLGRKA